MLFVVVLSLSRASVAYFLMQLTPIRKQRRFLHILLGFIAAWALAFLFAVALSCNSSEPWELLGRKCTGYVSFPTTPRYVLIVH